jgi:hypothetical protein
LKEFNNNRVFILKLLFLIGGFSAGFLSLFFSIFIDSFFQNFDFWHNWALISIIFLVLLEEIIKFISINFITVEIKSLTISNIFNAIFFGFGFGFFELFLILFQTSFQESTLFSAIPLFSIHILTSILILLAIYFFKKNLLITFSYFILAFFIHLIYNWFIHIYIF